MASLTEKIITIQKTLVAPKSNYNSFGKYKYRSAEDILEAVKPLNAEQGLLLTIADEAVTIGDWHYIKATLIISDGEGSHTVTAYARESESKKGMDASQITGTASSYARKYALNGLYLIDDTKDADTDEYQNTQNKQPKQQAEKEPSKAIILGKFKTGGGTEEQFNTWYAKQLSAGVGNQQMADFLTKKLVDKQKEKQEG